MRPSAKLSGKLPATIFRASALVRAQPIAVGSLVDLLADDGSGAFALALRMAADKQRPTSESPARTVVVVDPTGDFYPPAAHKAGVDLERLLVVRARSANAAWLLGCLDEALRSRAVAAVVARVRRRDGLDGPASHRLRVAAEAGGGLGIFVRPLDDRSAVSAAAVRLVVRGSASGPALEPLRVRGGVALESFRAGRGM